MQSSVQSVPTDSWSMSDQLAYSTHYSNESLRLQLQTTQPPLVIHSSGGPFSADSSLQAAQHRLVSQRIRRTAKRQTSDHSALILRWGISRLSVAPSVCPSVPCLRFSQSRKAVETSNLVETARWTTVYHNQMHNVTVI